MYSRFARLSCLSVAIFALSTAPQSKAATFRSEVLASGLSNPRGLLISPQGQVLVAEAGSGGPANPGPCIVSGAGSQLCFGLTGYLGLFDPANGSYARPLSNLPSLARSTGEEGSGLSDLAYAGNQLLGIWSFGGDPTQLVSSGSSLFGQLVSIDLAAGTITPKASISQYELDHDPDGPNHLNSNPYALAVFAGKTWVTDAGGNTLLNVDGSDQVNLGFTYPIQNVSLPSFLPSPPFPDPYPAQAVPTGLAVKDGYLYSAELSGFPFVAGTADIYRTDSAGVTSLFASGFNSIIDLAFGPEGDLFVLQYADNFFSPQPSGSLLQISADGLSRQVLMAGLTRPTALALDGLGRIYVTNNGDGTSGELLRLTREVPAPGLLLGGIAALARARRLRRRLGGLRRSL